MMLAMLFQICAGKAWINFKKHLKSLNNKNEKKERKKGTKMGMKVSESIL